MLTHNELLGIMHIMPEPVYYTTIRYRQKKKGLFVDNLLHKGNKAMVQLSAVMLEVRDVTNSRILSSTALTDITSCHEKKGNVYLTTPQSNEVFDFCPPFHSGLIPPISSRKRAQEFMEMLQKQGVQIQG